MSNDPFCTKMKKKKCSYVITYESNIDSSARLGFLSTSSIVPSIHATIISNPNQIITNRFNFPQQQQRNNISSVTSDTIESNGRRKSQQEAPDFIHSVSHSHRTAHTCRQKQSISRPPQFPHAPIDTPHTPLQHCGSNEIPT